MRQDLIPDYVASALQLSMLLELSGHPKPGNIDRQHDFNTTRYEHFLSSIACLGRSWRRAALDGYAFPASTPRTGLTIYDASNDMMRWQTDGNTSFGSILLLIPLATAAGAMFRKSEFEEPVLRRFLRDIIDSTTVEDALYLYKAIEVARPGGLGNVPSLDATDKKSYDAIQNSQVTLKEVFRLSSRYDSISREWSTGFEITFELGCPYFRRMIEQTNDVNVAVVHTFLRILSETPDTLIARRCGQEKAAEISKRAHGVLKAGGLLSGRGRASIARFDKKLRTKGHLLNPGATADLACSSVAVAVLGGFRP